MPIISISYPPPDWGKEIKELKEKLRAQEVKSAELEVDVVELKRISNGAKAHP